MTLGHTYIIYHPPSLLSLLLFGLTESQNSPIFSLELTFKTLKFISIQHSCPLFSTAELSKMFNSRKTTWEILFIKETQEWVSFIINFFSLCI